VDQPLLGAPITLVADDYKRREPGAPDIDGPDAQRAYREMVFNAFPDIHIEELHRVADGDLVAIHAILTGTHRGELSGIPATEATVRFEAQEVYRVRDGKIAEHFVLLDTLGLMQQLGVIAAQ
jgi:predicted ester cyclase